jgi:poly[(R)-3-hydroxyalkanoate] polymerase subunit PhaC
VLPAAIDLRRHRGHHRTMATSTSVTEDLSAETTDAILGANPFIGLSRSQIAAAAGRFFGQAARHAPVVAKECRHLAAELADVVRGRAPFTPDAKDRRFSDDAYRDNALYRRLAQAYLASCASADALVGKVNLDPKSEQRARFALSLVTEAMAPTNQLAGNPAAMRKAVETKGKSLLDGTRHFLDDLRHNGGMPSMVDRQPFRPGDTVAVTPGAVVYRDEVLELIQYRPATATVRERPLVVVPPQINKFYVMDLAPTRSMVEYLVASGQQVFMVSWRNPTAEQRDWDLDTYVGALLAATDVARAITRSPDVNVAAACSGGITSGALLGHLAAIGDERVASLTLLVTVLDMAAESAATVFLSEPAAAAALRRSRRKGVLSGQDLGRTFAWLRPNDLVWNYWVNNYLLGNRPPAFDVLAWNADSTNLPAGLHADFLMIALENALARPGRLDVLGQRVDLGKVTCDAYVVGALTDHITPWQGCYRSVHVLGGRSRFVLSSSGHIQALVNPPGNPKATYFTNDDLPTDPTEWRRGAAPHSGTWWDDWVAWLGERSGDFVRVNRTLGSRRYPAGDPAPGQYVLAGR